MVVPRVNGVLEERGGETRNGCAGCAGVLKGNASQGLWKHADEVLKDVGGHRAGAVTPAPSYPNSSSCRLGLQQAPRWVICRPAGTPVCPIPQLLLLLAG